MACVWRNILRSETMIHFLRLLSVVLVGLIFITGCGDSGTKAGDGKKKIVIGIVAKSVTNPVFQAAHAGAKDAARELSAKHGVEIEVNIQTPPAENPEKQAEAIATLVRLGAKGIAVSCSEANTLTGAIDKAVDAGIPVVCFDSDAAASKRMCYYGTDDTVCGTEVMKLLAKEMGGKGTVAILGGNETAPNLRKRVDAVRAELKNYPEMKEVSVGTVYHEEEAAKAAEKLQQIQRVHPEITGWALVGGWPLFTRDALPWKPGAVKVVSVDALPDQLTYLESGHVQVLIAQDCYGWGHRSVELLVDKVVNQKEPPQKMIIDPLTQVTKGNAGEWSKKWDKWLKK
jgi:ribose transport system substrate-binding protein